MKRQAAAPKNTKEIVCRLCHLLTASDPCSDCIRERNKPKSPLRKLSPRESEVVRFIVCGLPNRETAKALGISEKTVEAHRANINRKLGIKGSVVELALKAILRGYASMPIEFGLSGYGAADTTKLILGRHSVIQDGDHVVLKKP